MDVRFDRQPEEMKSIPNYCDQQTGYGKLALKEMKENGGWYQPLFSRVNHEH
jgi:hypothetical protein